VPDTFVTMQSRMSWLLFLQEQIKCRHRGVFLRDAWQAKPLVQHPVSTSQEKESFLQKILQPFSTTNMKRKRRFEFDRCEG